MDAAAQQATAVNREGDPSQPRPNGTEIKVDAANGTKNSENTSKSKDPTADGLGEKKKKKTAKKKHAGTRGRLGKDKKKKNKAIVTASSSDSADSSSEDSDSDSEDDDTNASTKKRPDARKTNSPTKAKNVPISTRATAETDSGYSCSDSEDEEDATSTQAPRNSKNNRAERQDPNLVALVSREVQRALEHTQVQHRTTGTGPYGAGAPGAAWLAMLNNAFNLPLNPGFVPPMPAQAPGPAGRAPPPKSGGLDGGPVATGGRNVHRGAATTRKKLGYKRVDQVWDSAIHNFKLQDTIKVAIEAKHNGFYFHVRRTFDWEGKYKSTFVDIKSKALRECLQDVIGNIKGVSLVDETPKIDPNVLFL